MRNTTPPRRKPNRAMVSKRAISRSKLVGSSVPTSLHLTVNGKAVKARLVDSPTTRDFVQLLPLTLRMNDLFNREKFGHLPRTLSATGRSTHRHAVGKIVYWPADPDIAVFYRDDGESTPDPGVIGIGKVTSGIEAFAVRGAATVL